MNWGRKEKFRKTKNFPSFSGAIWYGMTGHLNLDEAPRNNVEAVSFK
jgi:hypothetical protein